MRVQTTAIWTAASILGVVGGGCGAAFQGARSASAAEVPASSAVDGQIEAAYAALAKAQMRGAPAAEVAALQARVRELEAVRARLAGGQAAAVQGSPVMGIAPAAGGGVVEVPGADLPYFGAGGQQLRPIVPPPPPVPPDPSVGAVVVRLSEVKLLDSGATGLLTEVLGYIGDDLAGFVLGYSRIGSDNGTDGVELGGSFFRYYDAVQLFQAGSVTAWLSLPAVDTVLGLYFPSGEDVILRLSAGLEVVGFRVAACLGTSAIVAELRGPRVGISMYGASGGDPEALFEIGGSASVGLTW